MYVYFFKRVIDFSLSLLLLIITLPVIIITSIVLVFINSGSPFYFQIRPGLHCKLFKIIKFKTMNDKKNLAGEFLPDSERITRIGKIIRSTSIDELPQLLNVIKGDMSLVGPRPLLVQYLELYNANQAKRHNVRPGITGLAQVTGRNAISWEEKFGYDISYVDNISLRLDCKIIFLTIKKVIIREGISQNNQATMEPFKGNDK